MFFVIIKNSYIENIIICLLTIIFNTWRVKSMTNLFKNRACLNFRLLLFNIWTVIDMSEKFYQCESLTSLDIFHFKTNKVENMNYMFSNCKIQK